MTLKPNKVRVIIRWIHIIGGLILMCYIYSPFHKYIWFQLFVKILVLPLITLTGIWVWKFKSFNKFFGIKESSLQKN